jgi:hypothetical protein
VIVVTITHDHGARLRSYELIADAFKIGPPADGDTILACPTGSTSPTPTSPTS